MNPDHSRRTFLKTTAAALAFPTIIPASALGKNGTVAPSNRIVMAGIGIGGRGRRVLDCFLKQPQVQFVAIADVQEERREAVRRIVNRRYGNEDCVKHRDMYEVLNRDDIDVLQITTGDRWHALASILAAKAGKDVYCEKPCSMTIREAQQLADAFNKHERIFQAGTQRRNVDNFRFAAGLARSGKLGTLHTVHAGILAMKPDATPLPEEPLPDPEVIDWDRWLGPAPWRPYNIAYVRGRWRGHYDFHCRGSLAEWGSHTLDLCQWAATKDETVPVKFRYEGDSIIGHYADGVKLVMRRAGFRGEGGWVVPGSCPVRFEGDEGWVEAADTGKLAASSDTLLEGMPKGEMPGIDPIKHVQEFLACVVSRTQPATGADVTRKGHIACHAAAIGWQLGRTVNFDPKTERFVNDDEANRMCSKVRRSPWDEVKA